MMEKQRIYKILKNSKSLKTGSVCKGVTQIQSPRSHTSTASRHLLGHPQ